MVEVVIAWFAKNNRNSIIDCTMETVDTSAHSPPRSTNSPGRVHRGGGGREGLLSSPSHPRPLANYTTLGSPIHPRDGGAIPIPVVGEGGRVRSFSWGCSPPVLTYLPVQTASDNPQSSLPLHPPEIIEQRRAMEAAAAKERQRAKKLEEEEMDLSADQLREILKRERHRTAKIQADLASLRFGTVQQQLEAEVIEEGRINGLMRRLDMLQEEKGRIIVELEREEGLFTDYVDVHPFLTLNLYHNAYSLVFFVIPLIPMKKW